MSAFKYFTMMECPRRLNSANNWAKARLQCRRERERRRFKLNALAARTATLWTMVRVWRSRDKAGYEWPSGPVTVRQLDVRWLQVRAWHLRNQVIRALRAAKTENFKNVCSDIGKNPRKAWNQLNSLMGKKASKVHNLVYRHLWGWSAENSQSSWHF